MGACARMVHTKMIAHRRQLSRGNRLTELNCWMPMRAFPPQLHSFTDESQKCPLPIRSGHVQGVCGSEHEPQAELQNALGIGRARDLAKAPGIAYVAARSGKNYRIEQIERLGAEFQPSSLSHDRKRTEDGEIQIPVSLRVVRVGTQIAKGPKRRSLERIGIDPACLGLYMCPVWAAARVR